MERGYSNDWAAELAGALDWWTQAGVDCLVEDQPRAWLKAPEILSETGGVNEGSPLDISGTPDVGPLHHSLRERSPSPSRGGYEVKEPLPDQLSLFQEWLRTSQDLPYATPAAPRICPSGDPAAGLMVLAGMPSTEDCTSGALLSGAAGRLFDRMLAAIGRSRDTIYLAGLSCLRAPGGRFNPAGATRCGEIARHHLGLVAPKAVLLLGDGSAQPLLGLGVAQARGRVHEVETPNGSFRAVATLSPDYLLSQPSAKARAWADLQLLMETLK